MILLAKRTLILTVLLLLSVATRSRATEYEAAVEAFTVTESANSVEFTIHSNQDVRYTYFELDGPRLVVDFHNADNHLDFNRRPVGHAGVERVRASFFSDESRDATRVIFDLREKTDYEVIKAGDGRVRVRFGPGPFEPLETRVALEDRPADTLEPVVSAAGGESGPAVDATVSMPRVEPADRPAGAVSPPDQTSQELLARPVGEPVVTVTEVASLRPSPPPLPAAARTVSPNAVPTVEVRPPLAAPPPFLQVEEPLESEEPQYTGEIVTFDLVGSDIRDFFRVIAELSGLNIIVDDQVTGQLNMTLNNVPWDQALDVVLRTNDLGYELQGNILRIAPQSTLQAEEEARRALRQAQALNVPLETRPYLLSYTTAAAVNAILQEQNLLSERGSSVVDPRRNALLVTDVPDQFPRIASMVEFLDTPSQQVEIEARLLSATKSFSRELGSQLGLVIGNNGQAVVGGNATSPSPISRTPPPNFNVDGSSLPLIADFPSAGSSGLSFLLGVGGDVLLDEIISVAEDRGTAKLLSRPRVVTQNNEEATVSQGTQIPVQTNVNNTISVQFIPFSLSLSVTPQITEAGTILLDAQIENSSPDFARAVGGVPSVSTQEAQTRVLIPDGGTAVVGGILIDNDSVNVSQIPGLGNIPLLGNLFKSTSSVKTTSELLFFITARIRPANPLDFLSGASEEEEADLFGALDGTGLQ